MAITLDSLVLSNEELTLIIGDLKRVTATAVYSDGRQVDVSEIVDWSSDNLAACVIGSNGQILAIAEGLAVVSASLGGLSAEIDLEVTDVPPPVTDSPYGTLINCSTPFLNSSTAADYQIALPWWVSPTATRVKVKIYNRDSLSGTGTTAIAGVELAVGTSDGAGDFASAPEVIPAIEIPADGDPYVSDWIDITRGSDGKILIAYSVPASSSTYYNTQTAGVANFSASGVSAYPLSGVSTATYSVLFVALEVDDPGDRVIVVGDSLAIGLGVSNINASAYQKLQTEEEVTCGVVAIGGVKLQDYANAGKPWLLDYALFEGATVIIEAGINDLGTRTLGQMQADYEVLVDLVREAGAIKIVAQTITPSAYYVAGDATRVNFNAWLMGLPLDIDAVADVASELEDPMDSTQLLATYDSGDHIHWSDAGHAAALPIIVAALAS